MPEHVIFVTNELQEQRLAQLEAAIHKQRKDIRRLANAGLLLLALGLLLQKQVLDILNHKEEKKE